MNYELEGNILEFSWRDRKEHENSQNSRSPVPNLNLGFPESELGVPTTRSLFHSAVGYFTND